MNTPSGKRIVGPIIRLHVADNVVVTRTPVAPGTAVPEEEFVTRDQVPAGYKIAARDGQIAGGANLIAFTTGRGSCFGCTLVPSLKLATNTPMYERMEEDMDLNCGEVLDGTVSIEEMGQRIFALFLRTASGERTKSELLGLRRHEFVPWQIGIMG